MPDSEIRNPKSEFRKKSEARRDADFRVGALACFVSNPKPSRKNREPHEIRERRRAFGKEILPAGNEVHPYFTFGKLPIFALFALFAVHFSWNFWRAWSQIARREEVHFRKYRVAPRLGTDTVRRRLLRGVHTHAPFTATGTALVS